MLLMVSLRVRFLCSAHCVGGIFVSVVRCCEVTIRVAKVHLSSKSVECWPYKLIVRWGFSFFFCDWRPSGGSIGAVVVRGYSGGYVV